jgi:hypothetical protein
MLVAEPVAAPITARALEVLAERMPAGVSAGCEVDPAERSTYLP